MLIILFMPKAKRVFISDCEGPISKNDNAFELSSKFIPYGDKLFPVVSRYDDVLADVVKKPKYKAGDTLRLILPFFKAYEVTDKMMIEESSNNILLVPGAPNTLKAISKLASTFIVSTSYEHYIRALCGQIDFPFESTYSTRLNLDSFGITETEKEELKKTASEIANMPVINIPKSNRLEEFSEEDKRNIERLDYIFWKRTPQMTVGRILDEVNPIGGYEKANAVKNITKKLGVDLADTMYVGDSITDVEAFRLVREGSGLTVSFNGNNYAVREAEIGVTSPDTSAIEFIAGTFIQEGKEDLLDELKRFPRIETITQENMEEFSKHSSKFRKTVRGEAVGKLG